MKRFLHWTAVLVLVLFVLFWLGISLRSRAVPSALARLREAPVIA
jgi:hypothetical protein